MRTFLITLLTSSAAMSGLALLYMAAAPLLAKRYSKKWLYYAWLVIVIGLIIPFRPQLENAILRIEVPVTANTEIAAAPPAAQPAAQPGDNTSIIPTDNAEGAAHTPSIPSKAHTGVPWETVTVYAWMAGGLVSLGYQAVKHRRFYNAARRWSGDITDEQTLSLWRNAKEEMGVTGQIQLQRCEFIGSPLLTGILHPRILLPKGTIPGDELALILKHELVHFKRKDLWYKGMVLLSVAIHWFNPVVYFMAKAINLHCENACDEGVVRGTDADGRLRYSEAIIGAIRHSKLVPALSTHFYGGKKGMKNRITSIMDTSKKRAGGILILCVLLLAAAAGIAFAATAAEIPTGPREINPEISVSRMVRNGKNCLVQTATLDLDGDGADEQITAYFSCEGLISLNDAPPVDIYDTCEIAILKGNKEYTAAWTYDNMMPHINFAEFDTRSGLIHFYFDGDGPSGDPFTQIFCFDGAQIVKNTGFQGAVTRYDGMGRIYSYDIYSVNCYYDLTNGLTPLPKDEIIGTEIQRDLNLLLCTKPGKGFTAAALSYYYEEYGIENYIEPFRDEFICLVPANTNLVVIDIEFQRDPWNPNSDEMYNVPWLKVRLPDGTEGWFCIVYGD